MSDNNDLDIVIGDDSHLNISEVGDCANNLRPKTSKKKKNVIIPVPKKKDEEEKK